MRKKERYEKVAIQWRNNHIHPFIRTLGGEDDRYQQLKRSLIV